MANKVRFQHDIGGIRELLKSEAVMAKLEEEATKAEGAANGMVNWHAPMEAEAFTSWSKVGNYTALAFVGTRALGDDGMAAVNYNSKHKVLQKSIRM